ncbi:MAG: methylated-DNA--[protein]-cysteine S-methyltransferase [Cytophagaceae bacterium]|nr:methylated-DNA--[protein]-cysteine S-methyltransferase [Gemmatimonadaceae bacterium]
MAVFDTALGPCAFAWGDAGVVGVQLPEGDAFHTLRRLARRFPDAAEHAVPATLQDAMAGIVALLAGGSDDLAHVGLDMTGVPAFHRRVYALARAISPGATSTYGEIASRLGNPLLAREVGQALGGNPFPIVVPCHRVLAAGGRMGGFSAPGGVDTKRRMLEMENAAAVAQRSLFDCEG